MHTVGILPAFPVPFAEVLPCGDWGSGGAGVGAPALSALAPRGMVGAWGKPKLWGLEVVVDLAFGRPAVSAAAAGAPTSVDAAGTPAPPAAFSKRERAAFAETLSTFDLLLWHLLHLLPPLLRYQQQRSWESPAVAAGETVANQNDSAHRRCQKFRGGSPDRH